MAKIYTQAKLVYVWLGESNEGESEDTGAAFRFISTVLQLNHFDNLVGNEDLSTDWNNMVELMKREWFNRRWIVQEIALADRAEILCGTHRINWVDFADAVSLFVDAEAEKQTISRVMRGKKEFGYKPRYFGYVPALGATRLVEVTNDLFRRRADHEKVALLSLEQIVSTFTAFNSTEPRDAIYAVLAVARDTMPRTSQSNMMSMVASYTSQIQKKFIEQLSKKIVAKSYYVNYDQPVSDVFVDFVDFAICQSDKTRALDIICRPWAPLAGLENCVGDDGQPWRHLFDIKVSERKDNLGRDGLPSWIKSIDGAAYGLEPKSKRMVRKNPDTLVGVPPQRNYLAAGTIPVTKALRFEQGITRFSDYPHLNNTHYHSMFVEGFVVDVVQNVKTASQMGNIPKDWAQLGRQYAQPGEQWKDLPDEYWRTLVADRSKNGNPPRHYPRLINHALESHVQGDTFYTQEKIDHPDCQAVRDVLERVQSVIWNRRLARTKANRLGLVPEYAEKGDLIVILYGCTVPVVLRKFTKTKREVENEEKTKIPRVDKMAARKLIETLRVLVAQRKERERSGQPQDPQRAADEASSAKTKDKTQSSHSRGNSEQINLHTDGPKFAVPEGIPIGARDPETISISSERSLQVPGSWVDTPPVSRKATEIVAPGPVPPRSVAEPGRNSSRAPAQASDSISSLADKLIEAPLQADRYTFYQLVGECYLHGMMNGEAIPQQRSAEDSAKQRTAQAEARLTELKRADEKGRELPHKEYIKTIKRSYSEPPQQSQKASKAPEVPENQALFMRTLFELR